LTTPRPYDIILFGATGFTGGLTAEYLARHAPDTCRWALAGRNPAKLQAVRDRLTAANPTQPTLADLPLLTADATDQAALTTITAQTRVAATTIGPYATHGRPLVAACAETGTDYLDLTGEPEFVDRTYLDHHEQATRTGARLIHACGFDSVPHDLGALFTVRHLPRDVPLTVDGYVRAGGAFSGGTLASFLLALSRPRTSQALARRRRTTEPRPEGRTARAVPGRAGWSKDAHAWVVPMPSLDPLIVARSAAALPEYGPEFRYRHFAAVKHLPIAVGGVLGIAGLFAVAQIPPLRRGLSRIVKPGDGPDEHRRAKGWFTVRFVGEGGGRRIVTEVSGGDPGYGETSKMLAEAALCLAFDDLPHSAGQTTTAAAMGDRLIDRLIAAGIEFTVLDAEPSSARLANPPTRRRSPTA
jgi:short subunit dehydrogenase-like uncharacterized protein